MKKFPTWRMLGWTAVVALGTTVLTKMGGRAVWATQILNNRIDAAITGLFLALVALTVCACARAWVQLLRKRRAPVLCEEPYVALEAAGRA